MKLFMELEGAFYELVRSPEISARKVQTRRAPPPIPKTGDALLRCDRCGMVFKAEGWLDRHKRAAHGA